MPRLHLLALAVSGLASCHSPLSFSDRRFLAVAEERWSRRGFADYSFEMMRSCFCPPEMNGWSRVEVAGGAIARVVLLRDGTIITDSRRDHWATVEELFEAIRDAADDEWLERIEFEFDETLGFPTVIRWIPKPDILDGGGTDYLRNVVPLP